MLRFVKCMTCKKFILIDKSPWATCEKYPEEIPNEIYQNDIDDEQPIKCDWYEFDPHWED